MLRIVIQIRRREVNLEDPSWPRKRAQWEQQRKSEEPRVEQSVLGEKGEDKNLGVVSEHGDVEYKV